jgi:site-specific recombinase XerD
MAVAARGVALKVVAGQPDAWRRTWSSFERSLKADPKVKSAQTIKTYREGGEKFYEFLVQAGHDLDPKTVTKPVIEEFVAELRAKWTPSTVHTRLAALRRFFGWMEAEEIMEHSPMAKIRMGRVEENSPDVLKSNEIEALLAACAGKGFEERRDLALLRLALDTGMRRAELAAMPYDVAILDRGSYTFKGKGGHERTVYFGDKVISDLDRYLRAREAHPHAKLPKLWLAQKGALSGDGIHHIVRRRSQMAGIAPRGPHALRHTWADAMKRGASEEDVMRLGGWRDRKSMTRYGQSQADERASIAARKNSLGDKF